MARGRNRGPRRRPSQPFTFDFDARHFPPEDGGGSGFRDTLWSVIRVLAPIPILLFVLVKDALDGLFPRAGAGGSAEDASFGPPPPPEPEPEGDPFELLGLADRPRGEITAAEVNSAYRKASLAVHPDRDPSPGAHERFLALGRAKDACLRALEGSGGEEDNGGPSESRTAEDSEEEEDPEPEPQQTKGGRRRRGKRRDSTDEALRHLEEEARRMERERLAREQREAAAERRARFEERLREREKEISARRQANHPQKTYKRTPREEAEHDVARSFGGAPPPPEPEDEFRLADNPVAVAMRTRSYATLGLELNFRSDAGEDWGGGNNALHYAARFLDPRAVHIVLQAAGPAWADLAVAKNGDGQTPLELAEASAADPAWMEYLRRRREEHRLPGGDRGPEVEPDAEAVLLRIRDLWSHASTAREQHAAATRRTIRWPRLLGELLLLALLLLLSRSGRPLAASILGWASWFLPPPYGARTGWIAGAMCFLAAVWVRGWLLRAGMVLLPGALLFGWVMARWMEGEMRRQGFRG
ncbi:hypothetical protein DFJ74DRAFT_645835 [Hyaloraphidium curvatum]|nr:hypothetical protein DFJ74DRAFT_645835 [Hyaloraphidium curvatum]